MNNIHKQRGFTLVEGMIALTVISVGLIATLTLSISNILTALENERRAVAANLAREGLEVVRNQRDGNWLKRAANIDKHTMTIVTDFYEFDDFLDNGVISTFADVGALAELVIDGGVYRLKKANVIKPKDNVGGANCLSAEGQTYPLICQCMEDGICKVNLSAAGYGDTTGEATMYHRLITIEDICYDDSLNDSALALDEVTALIDQSPPGGPEARVCGTGLFVAYKKIGVLVTSHVRYLTNAGSSREIRHDIIVKEKMYDWRQ